MWVFVNDKIVPAQQAVVSAMDHGFLYGIGLFETIRIYQGKPCFWNEHMLRLENGMTDLRIRHKWERSDIYRAVQATLEKNKLEDAYVRISVTGGAEGVGLHSGVYEQPSLYIFVKSVMPIAEPPIAKRLKVISFPRQTQEGNLRFKSHNYLNCALGKQEIGGAPDIEGLFLTKEGYICEGVVSNVFWVKDNIVYTPSIDTNLLAGITRNAVLTIAHTGGFNVEEGLYPLEELFKADEVFVTNSIQEIVPVSTVENVEVPYVYGKLTQKLHEAYRRLVELSN
ncbi:4-amino-4-deoxychorismate lyase [Brevibacillus laterosporus]|uniref:Branched-chain-amino-acid aminotransferase n=1 Tax=Brevibacillus laterosporus LMG 15441 TaxID=1042163 RepID=A0A075R015_BRELA|nr:aminodeoxychorismate lyase [Brevibacillus laterosporus]AIG24543.1 branched-chain-amino-acid aminotransferase [Brevibacillus laterosporus LMG 15441]RJL09221.1 4-amino-4-deoxychorismate lyase [Brevibacillus laterosporus]TPH16062.1 4-amino-4-deoxychorismate lyase [Brevibacillus laterosporus]